MASQDSLITPEFRLSFPALKEPKSGPDGGQEKYRVTMLFPKGENIIATLRKAILDAAKAKWGDDKAKWPTNLRTIDFRTHLSQTGRDGFPIRDGDAQGYDGYSDHVSITASSTQQPGVVNRRAQAILDLDEVYAGCYCRAEVVAFAYDKAGNRGLSFGLRNIQKLREGDAFSGRKRPELVFEDLGAETQNPDADDMFE